MSDERRRARERAARHGGAAERQAMRSETCRAQGHWWAYAEGREPAGRACLVCGAQAPEEPAPFVGPGLPHPPPRIYYRGPLLFD